MAGKPLWQRRSPSRCRLPQTLPCRRAELFATRTTQPRYLRQSSDRYNHLPSRFHPGRHVSRRRIQDRRRLATLNPGETRVAIVLVTLGPFLGAAARRHFFCSLPLHGSWDVWGLGIVVTEFQTYFHTARSVVQHGDRAVARTDRFPGDLVFNSVSPGTRMTHFGAIHNLVVPAAFRKSTRFVQGHGQVPFFYLCTLARQVICAPLCEDMLCKPTFTRKERVDNVSLRPARRRTSGASKGTPVKPTGHVTQRRVPRNDSCRLRRRTFQSCGTCLFV